MGTGVPPRRIATGNVFSSGGVTPSYLPPEMSDAAGHPPSHLNSNTAPTSALLRAFLRKEVIQPHLPIRLPCYDFTPVTGSTFGSSFLSVGSLTSGISDSHGVTGGVYKTRERIHRGILIRDY